MTQQVESNDRKVSFDELPESVAALTVAHELVEAGITFEEASHLDYIIDQVYFEGSEKLERLFRFSALIALATMIAAFGLLADSVAVVIGAMLVAPLMTPIMGMAVSIVLTEAKRLASSARTVLGGAAGAVATGWFIALIGAGGITPGSLPGEVVSRTAPGLLDLGIAIAAGLAGGYLMVDRRAAASAAGVAIAVALVPPLATVGICIELGVWPQAVGALLLFGTNLVAIVLSASVVIAFSRVVPSGFVRVRFRQLRLGFALVLLAVVAVSIPLAIHTGNTIEADRFQRLVVRTVEAWDPRAVIIELDTEKSDVWDVDLQISVAEDRSPSWQLAEMITQETGQPIDLRVGFVTEQNDSASTR